MKYNVLGVSSGIGVSLFPFKDHLVGNIEPRAIFHAEGEPQWVANFRGIPLWKDFKPAKEHLKGKHIHLMISSPDCGSGSILRYSRAKKLGDIKGNASLDYFFAGVNHFKPDFFYFENLPSISRSLPDVDFDEKLDGYNIIRHNSSVAAWGNSQLFRKRLIVIGISKKIPLESVKKYFKLPRETNHKTCFELYGDLDKWDATPGDSEVNWLKAIMTLGHARETGSETISIHGGRRMLVRDIRKAWKDIKGRRWPVTDGHKYKTAPGVYRNRKNDYPATARKANRQFDHNGQMLTPRQLARIQGVPDEFKIYNDPAGRDKLNYWINKGRAAVTKTPPYEISVWLKRKLEKILINGL